MQTKHESIIRAINNLGKSLNILTFPTHEAYWANHVNSSHNFYLYQGEHIKSWNNNYRQLPPNHILLDGSEAQVKLDMKFDIVLSQNKYGQFQIAEPVARHIGIPLVSIEHTLPYIGWSKKHIKNMNSMRGDINIFISEYSINQWGFDKNDPTVRVIHHGIDVDIFKPSEDRHNDGKILTVVNDWINRDWCCNFSLYKKLCLNDNLPVNPVGDTPNLSKPAKDTNDLVSKYQNASVFLNTSIISPVPTSLLEAMSCGCPVVTTATCMIPEIIQDGVNGFISNDESYLREKLIWCLKNPEESREIGKKGRETILNKFSLEKHLESWENIFKEVYGKQL